MIINASLTEVVLFYSVRRLFYNMIAPLIVSRGVFPVGGKIHILATLYDDLPVPVIR